MKLNLEFPPTAEYAEKHAEIIVNAMMENEGVELDYSLESLLHVDALLKMFNEQGATIERIPSILFRLGCYAGEVVRRYSPSSKWANPADFLPESELDLFPFVVIKHENGNVFAPVNKVFAVLESPDTDSIHLSCDSQLAKLAKEPKSFWSKIKNSLF